MQKRKKFKVDVMSATGRFICTLSYVLALDPEGAFDPCALKDYVISRLPTLKNKRFEMVIY